MIIQCEKCQTRFRLDDSRVTDKGVKVRCTKCKNVFRVHREEHEADLFMSDSSMADSLYPTESYELEIANREVAESEPAEPSVNSGEIDFSGFDFGETALEPDSTPDSTISIDDFTDTEIETPPAAPKKIVSGGLDFSDDDMFGAVVESTNEAPKDTISFDFADDSFAESMDMSGQDPGGKSGTAFSLDTGSDSPFSLSDIDFGDELTSVAVQQVNPEDLRPSQKILFAPMADAHDKVTDDDLKQAFQQEDTVPEQQELPPLSISSRRKRNPVFAVVMSTIILLVLLFLGYLGYTSFCPAKEVASLESGKISVQNVKATYITNEKAGELLVISGEALNEYAKPRAALQVKATVFDSAGQTVTTKSAYCGNPLSEEQLESVPLEKMEVAMANQFGDSLVNMEVAAGKPIPFVIVLANLPKGAKDYAVESIGSTVATGKQE